MTESLNSSIDAKDRLSALRRTKFLDTPPEPEFDRVTKLLSRLLDANVSLLSLVDQDRQFFKSSCGLPDPWAQKRETPLSHSFCQHVVATNKVLAIEDARAHSLVETNLAIRDLGVIAYLGVPVRAPDGHILGSLCAIESHPRAWSANDIALVQDLAGVIEHEIALRDYGRRAAELARENSLLAQEYHHRVKNALAVAAALVTLSGREATSPKEVVATAQARLSALATAHDALERDADSVDLKQLADRLLQPYCTRDAKAEIDGRPVALRASQVTPMCLILHELATNAVKYGAFLRGGRVRVSWEHEDDSDVVLRWDEETGSGAGPDEAGFGSKLIEIAARQLGGSVSSDWEVGRLRTVLTFPHAGAAAQKAT
jgi:two-component sensor histidine kinase